MEAKPILSFFTKAVANIATAFVDRPILPMTVQDLPPHQRRPSPPPSPSIEVVVVSDAFPLHRVEGVVKFYRMPAVMGQDLV